MRPNWVGSPFSENYNFVAQVVCDMKRGAAAENLTAEDLQHCHQLSKVFELCIIAWYRQFFVTSNNQFGFKKTVGWLLTCNLYYKVRGR